MAEEWGDGLSWPWPAAAWLPGAGLGVSDGLIAGNRPEALPASMIRLATPLRAGIGPSGTLAPGEIPGGDTPAGVVAGEAGAAVTATVSAAAGGVHFWVVATLAAAVSFTAVTELALAATGICVRKDTGCLSDTAPTAQLAVPAPLTQPLVYAGFWLAGWEVRATVTPDAEPFAVDTRTT